MRRAINLQLTSPASAACVGRCMCLLSAGQAACEEIRRYAENSGVLIHGGRLAAS